MTTERKPAHIILSVIIVPVCVFLFIGYGWSAFSMISGRSGLTGNEYLYYNIGKASFITYTVIVAFASLALAACLIDSLITKTPKITTKILWSFLVFSVALVCFEIYLNSNFISKG